VPFKIKRRAKEKTYLFAEKTRIEPMRLFLRDAGSNHIMIPAACIQYWLTVQNESGIRKAADHDLGQDKVVINFIINSAID
jgi:hypothetical protein